MQRRSDERVQALLDALLEDRSAPGLAARAAAGLGLPEQGRYAVVVLRRGGGPDRPVMDADGMTFLRRMRADCEIVVVALGERGTDELTAVLVERCPGPGGISPVVDSLAELGSARRLADVALLTCPRARPGSCGWRSGCRRRWW